MRFSQKWFHVDLRQLPLSLVTVFVEFPVVCKPERLCVASKWVVGALQPLSEAAAAATVTAAAAAEEHQSEEVAAQLQQDRAPEEQP